MRSALHVCKNPLVLAKSILLVRVCVRVESLSCTHACKKSPGACMYAKIPRCLQTASPWCMCACMQNLPTASWGAQTLQHCNTHMQTVQHCDVGAQTLHRLHAPGGRRALHVAAGVGGPKAPYWARGDQPRPAYNLRPPSALQRSHVSAGHHPQRLPGPRVWFGGQL